MNYLSGSVIFLRRVWRNNPVVPIAISLVCCNVFFSQFIVLRILNGATSGLQGNPLRDRIVTIWQKDQRTLQKTGIYETAYYLWSPEVKSLTNIAATIHHPAVRLNVRFPNGHSKIMQGAIADAALFPLFQILPQVFLILLWYKLLLLGCRVMKK